MGGGSKSQTVGYRYYMGLHMIICYGPVDAVLELRGADRVAWKGSVTSSTFVNVNAPTLFGGDEKEGGIRGVLDIAMGEPTQMPNDYLEGVIGPGRPAYRGVLGLIFRSGLIAANNPYIKPWAIKVRRILKGWKGDEPWYPEKAEVLQGAEAPSAGDAVTATGSIGGAATSAYLFNNGGVVGFAQAADGVDVGGTYTVGVKAADLATASSSNITWQAGSAGDERLWLRGVSPAGYGISADDNVGYCELFRNGEFKATLVPDASYADSPWWYAEAWHYPEYGGLVWFSGSSVYIGVRTTGNTSVNHNKIYRWSLSATGTNVAADAVSPRIGSGSESIFWMHVGRNGNVYTLDSAGVVKEFSPDLALMATYSPTLPAGTVPYGIGVDGDTLVILDASATPKVLILSLSGGTLVKSVAHANIEGGTVRRVVFTDEGIYVQCGASTLRIGYTPGSAGAPTHAMNPAHIIYQCLTDDEWGMGYDDSILDLDSFAAAADTFHAEGMGLSLLWSRQDTIESFVQVVLDHAGAVLGEDRRTGKILLTPIRGDYDLEDLPHFSDTLGNIVSLQRFERGTPADAINELTVSFTDGLTGKTGGVTVQNLAAIQAAGRVISQSRDYPGFPTIELAARAAMRDLLAATAGLSRWKLTVNRDGYSLLPGKVIKVSWSDDGIVEMPLRVLQVDYGSLTDGKVQLECAEDVFGLPDTVYVKPQEPGWTDPSGPPQASPAIAALEVPYRELLQVLGTAETAALASDAGYVAAVAARPPGFSLNFRLYARTGADPFEDVAAGDWCPSGALAASLAPSGATVTLTGASALDRVKVGELAMLGEGVGAELVRIDAIDVGTSALTLGRGCADTVPRAWPAGTRFWAIDQYGAGSPAEYVEGETVDLKVLSMSGQGLLPELSAPGVSVELAARQVRPYPPGRLRFDDDLGTDVAYPVDLVGEVTVHWAHRDRLLQHDQLVDASEASIGPEPGTTYTVRYYLDDVLVETESGLTGTSATPYTYSGDGLGRVEVEALRDGHSSWQVAAADFTYFLEAPATRITDAGDIRITDAGDRRIKD